MLVDLQIHTSVASPDSVITPEELAHSAKEVGLDAVAVTEHRPPTFDVLREALEDKEIVLLPGREVSLLGAHVLVLSEDEELLKALPPLVLASDSLLQHEHIALVWAHPAAPAGSSAYPPSVFGHAGGLLDLIHGIEVLNGRHLHFEASVGQAETIAAGYNLGMTGGSDAHRPSDVGRCATFVESLSEDGAAGLVGAIRAGRTRPVLNERWAAARSYDYRPSLQRYLG